MNDQQLEKKVSQDAAKVKKDLGTLVENSADRLSRLGDQASQASDKAKENLTTWVEDSTTRLSEGFDKLTGDARESVVDTATTVKKDVGQRLNRLNSQANKVIHKRSMAAARKATIYSGLAVSLALVVGFLVGFFLLKPTPEPVG